MFPRGKAYLEWSRKKTLFSKLQVPRNLSHLIILLLHVHLLICIKFRKKNHHLLLADISKADISGEAMVWLELMDV